MPIYALGMLRETGVRVELEYKAAYARPHLAYYCASESGVRQLSHVTDRSFPVVPSSKSLNKT